MKEKRKENGRKIYKIINYRLSLRNLFPGHVCYLQRAKGCCQAPQMPEILATWLPRRGRTCRTFTFLNRRATLGPPLSFGKIITITVTKIIIIILLIIIITVLIIVMMIMIMGTVLYYITLYYIIIIIMVMIIIMMIMITVLYYNNNNNKSNTDSNTHYDISNINSNNIRDTLNFQSFG
jgi:hypothetical protein